MAAPRWKTIKIPAAAYDEAVALREKLAHLGLDTLPEPLRERAVDEAAGAGRGVGIGAVVALGLLALDDVLRDRSKRRRARR